MVTGSGGCTEAQKSGSDAGTKLIGDIIRRHPVRGKHEIKQLMTGEPFHKRTDENITFQFLDGDENSLWSLLLAAGYIKAEIGIDAPWIFFSKYVKILSE